MHPRVEQLPKPAPDYRRFLQVLRRERPERVPLIELAVHSEVVNTLLDSLSNETMLAIAKGLKPLTSGK